MQNKIFKITRKEDFRLFLRFLSVFTLIFLTMTTIIIQVMNASLYKTTDENLQALKRSPKMLVNFAFNNIGKEGPRGRQVGLPSSDSSSAALDTSSSMTGTAHIKDQINGGRMDYDLLSFGSEFRVVFVNEDGKVPQSNVQNTLSEAYQAKETVPQMETAETSQPTPASASDSTQSLQGESFLPEHLITEEYSGRTRSISKTSEAREESQDDVEAAREIVNNFNSFIEVLLYDADGNLINTNMGSFTNFDSIDPTQLVFEEVRSVDLENLFAESENYRMICIDMDSIDEVEEYDYATQSTTVTSIATVEYAVALINTSQLQAASQWNNQIVIVIMVIFWLISVAASMYLAKLSSQPIIASYEKQKAFAENASHELRTPLSVLQNRLENLFRKPDATILDSSESIASSLEEVRNMRILTQNLLDLARRDDGLEVKPDDVEPSFFDNVFDNYNLLAEEHGKTFIGHNEMTQVIHTDPALLRQVMTILYDNAIKYTEEDGQIEMRMTSNEPDNKFITLTVADNGPGISDVNKVRIFDRFYRVDKARSRQKAGFGLGLSLAKQIIDKFNGSITVKDNTPKGTIFEVKLPKQMKD